MNKDTFICPRMVVKLPYRLGTSVNYTHCIVLEVFRYSVDMLNLYTGNVYPLSIDDLRTRGELIGYNYKEKIKI